MNNTYKTVALLAAWSVSEVALAQPATAPASPPAPTVPAATMPVDATGAKTGTTATIADAAHPASTHDYTSLVFVFMLATFIGLGVVLRVSRLLHTPLMSLTNAISAIAVVGAIIVTGGENNPVIIRVMGAIAIFASMTNIVSGFLLTDRMLKMFKTPGGGKH